MSPPASVYVLAHGYHRARSGDPKIVAEGVSIMKLTLRLGKSVALLNVFPVARPKLEEVRNKPCDPRGDRENAASGAPSAVLLPPHQSVPA